MYTPKSERERSSSSVLCVVSRCVVNDNNDDVNRPLNTHRKPRHKSDNDVIMFFLLFF